MFPRMKFLFSAGKFAYVWRKRRRFNVDCLLADGSLVNFLNGGGNLEDGRLDSVYVSIPLGSGTLPNGRCSTFLWRRECSEVSF